jgi:acyl-CoA thioesterase I
VRPHGRSPSEGGLATFSGVNATSLVRAALAAAALLLALLASPGRAAPPVSFVALGDSTALGVGAAQGGGYPQRLAHRLEAAGVPVKLEVYAESGATAADVRNVQLPKVMSARPAFVTIGVGLADITAGRNLRDFARDLEVVADLVRRSKAIVVIATLPDLSLAPARADAPPSLARRIEAYNATLRTIAERHGFHLADVHAETRRAMKERTDLWARDGLHPSATGYDLWADAMWPAVERALAPSVEAAARRRAAR